MHVVHGFADANIPGTAIVFSETTMTEIDAYSRSPISASSNRRAFMSLFAGASLALAGAALAGCGNMDMRADPQKPKPKTMINGRGSGPGGGPGR
jgi:hypothetical protein